jgi:predicted NBD/HSP70 family sugar kinase
MLAATAKANQALTKRHNARLVLKTIYDQELVSRAAIARLTNLTATTVSHVIGELLAEELVEERGSLSTERGKPPVVVALNKDARHVIALNLAQQQWRGGILNLRGEVLYDCTINATGFQGEGALAAVYELVDALLGAVQRPLLGIGVGAPGILDLSQGVIRRAVNLHWYDVPLAQQLASRYALPIHIVNDNQASLLAEHLFGHYKQQGDLIVVRIGRGIGAGIMTGGQLLHTYAAGEIGHVTVVEGGEQCSCGNFGCLETVASSRAIVQRAERLLEYHPHSCLAQLQRSAPLDINAVIQAYRAGDRFLDPLVAEAGHYLGVAIAHVVAVLGSAQILLCGSVTGFGEPLLDQIKTTVQARSLVGQLQPPKIDLATLPSDIIMLGATALLLQNELGLF